MLSGTGMWLGYIIVKGGSLADISEPIFYRAACYGGVASLLSYLAVTLVIYKKIKPTKLPSEYPAV